MDILLILFLVLVITFLITEAFLYIVRPWFFITEEDIRMWDGFIFSISMAMVAVVICACMIKAVQCPSC